MRLREMRVKKMGKCKYYSTCIYSRSTSVTCVRDGGDYYGVGRKAGCYRDREHETKTD